MSILDDLSKAALDALHAGATAARGQGAALGADFEQLVKPGLDDIVAQIAGITEDLAAGNIGSDQAKSDIQSQMDGIQPLILAESELALLAVQVVIDDVVDALKSGVNAAIGSVLL
jgi:hypothetical protein